MKYCSLFKKFVYIVTFVLVQVEKLYNLTLQYFFFPENLQRLKCVPVEIRCSGSLYEHHEPFVIGNIEILAKMDWYDLDQRVREVVEGHFRQLDIGLRTKKTSRLDPETSPDVTQQFSLGFSLANIDSFNIGELYEYNSTTGL